MNTDFILEQVKNDTAKYKIVRHDQHPFQLNGLTSDIFGKIMEIFNPKIKYATPDFVEFIGWPVSRYIYKCVIYFSFLMW